ncbi:MAG: hypothetical protein ACSHXG_08660 [Maribacter stanieri]
MRKIVIISVILLLIVSCNQTREEIIINRLDSELKQRGLEIDSNFGLRLTIAPIKNKREALTISAYSFLEVENKDSLNQKIIKEAVRLENWFTLPEWDEANQSIFPFLNEVTTRRDSTLIKYPLNEGYEYTFHHSNYNNHKQTQISKRELEIWNVKLLDIVNSAFDNLEREINYVVYMDTLENRNIYKFKPNNERYHTSLLFTNKFKKDLNSKLNYPFYSVLRPWEYPTFIFGQNDLFFFKDYIRTKNINEDGINPYEISIIKYTENNIEIITLEK